MNTKQKNEVRLSPTSIACFYECPRKFFYIYIRGLVERVTPAKIRGKIIHKILEHFFNYVNIADIQEKEWEKLWKKFRKIFFSLLDTEWGMIGTEYIDCFKNRDEKKTYLEETKRFLDFYAAKLAFSLTSKMEEMNKESEWFEDDLKRFFYPKDRELRLELKNENISGIIDKTMTLFGEGIAIVDYKTSKCPLPHYIPESHLKQGKAYAYLWKESFGETPKHISFYYLRTGESVYYPISDKDMEEIKTDIDKIRKKKPVIEEFPKNESKICDYCDFHRFCFKNEHKNEKMPQ